MSSCSNKNEEYTYLVLNLELVPKSVQSPFGLSKDDQEQQNFRSLE